MFSLWCKLFLCLGHFKFNVTIMVKSLLYFVAIFLHVLHWYLNLFFCGVLIADFAVKSMWLGWIFVVVIPLKKVFPINQAPNGHIGAVCNHLFTYQKPLLTSQILLICCFLCQTVYVFLNLRKQLSRGN